VPVVIHKAEEHHGAFEGHSGGGLESLGHELSLQEHGQFDGHGLVGHELEGFQGHEGLYWVVLAA
jgi:hypothetical protein